MAELLKRHSAQGEMENISGRESGSCRWHVGRKPAHPTRLGNRDGGLTSGPEEVKATWDKHFSRLIPSQYSQAILDAMPSLPPATELDHPPTLRSCWKL